MSSRRTDQVRVHAVAKINLTLRVLGVRLDGYHELRTTFQSLALHDTLTFTKVRGPFEIECDDQGCPTDRTNLVWRAAEALWRARGRRGEVSGVRVRIRKRIPMEAGLGGGSSDAAATLTALTALWDADVPGERVRVIARDLGSDVPFFLEGGTVLGVERGDELFPLIDRPPTWVVLVLPGFGVSTLKAYRWWDEHARAGPDRGSRRPRPQNDLQIPVAARHPRIASAVRQLRRLGAHDAAMSGSGSAVFGLFEGEAAARRAASVLRGRSSATLVTRTLTRRQHQALGRARRG